MNIENNNNIQANKNKKNDLKKGILIGGCALVLGVGGVSLYNQNKNDEEVIDKTFEDFETNSTPVKLDFTDKTALDMRSYYTLEGEEFIKKIYPDSSDSDFALLTVGKSIEKELSNVKFKTMTNKEIQLKDLKGKKIILDFGLTSCGNCQNEFDFISKKDVKENEIFLHIFPNDSSDEIRNIFKESNVELNEENTVSLTGMNDLTFSDFSITHVPAKIYINEKGIVSYVTTDTIFDEENYNLHYERAYGISKKMLDFLKHS